MFKSLFSILVFLFAIMLFAAPVMANDGIQDAVGVIQVDAIFQNVVADPCGGIAVTRDSLYNETRFTQAIYAPNCRDVVSEFHEHTKLNFK